MTTAPASTAFPVHVDARLDPHLSRGLWLVKWFLAIPHYVVLAFLWIAFLVTTVMAFFTILVTGRYPRALFDFNVGVLRWSWRVSYYTYGALGTDRYPPFSLHDVHDYPAHLEIDYPQRLSRGLVLVKWWLLALPHYVVLGLFLGGVGYVAQEEAGRSFSGWGLISLLVLVAGALLLFTGRYPAALFDLILGLNRWVLRVAAYAALMTDRYPPFALDQGGDEPVERHPRTPSIPDVSAQPLAQASAQPRSPSNNSGWTAGRVTSLVIGSVLLVTSLVLAAAAGTLAVIDQGGRDPDGFLMSRAQTFDSPTHAITSSNLQLHTDAPGDFLPQRLLGDARLTADPGSNADLFLGIGATSKVRSYLAGVGHETVSDVRDHHPDYTTEAGSAPTTAPTEQSFWVAQDSGTGQRTITWPLADGDWTAVVMNADGSAAITAQVTVGAEVPALNEAVLVLAALAGLTLLLGTMLIAVPLRAASRRSSHAEQTNGTAHEDKVGEP